MLTPMERTRKKNPEPETKQQRQTPENASWGHQENQPEKNWKKTIETNAPNTQGKQEKESNENNLDLPRIAKHS